MQMESAPSRAEQLIAQLNANNAKKVAFLMVLGFILYHGIIHLQFGSDSCEWLLNDGRLKRDREWQPYGCMMHRYTVGDARRCFRYLAFWGRRNDFVFIGDNRLRAVYQAFVAQIRPGEPPPEAATTTEEKECPRTMEYGDPKLRLRVAFIQADEVAKPMIEEFTRWARVSTPPSAVVASCTYGRLIEGNFTEELEKAYITNLTRLVRPIDDLVAKGTKVIWKLQDPVDEDRREEGAWRNVINDDIERFNEAVYDTLGYTSAKIWSSSRLIAYDLIEDMAEGYQLSPLALRHNVQILLNMYCNEHTNYNDGTCCSKAEKFTPLQVIVYATLAVCFVIAVAVWLRTKWLLSRGNVFYAPLAQAAHCGPPQTPETSQLLYALSRLAIIMAYFYLCDRTNFFMKENKYYSEFSFWIPVGYVFVLGLFFTEDSRFTKVLHRDQTDEMKGWMQLVILVYYITGANRVIPIYMHIKVLISAYLFLAGYGHWSHAWQRGDVGVVRFLQVMFRLNFLTVLLCLCMNRPYQFYFFVPLLSYWVCVVFAVLALPPRLKAPTTSTCAAADVNGHPYLAVVLKLGATLAVITVLYMSEVLFERIFAIRPWRALFVGADDDVHEWWVRWKLDRYTVTYGMIFAACVHAAQRYTLFDDQNHGNLFSRRLSGAAVLLALAGIGFYTAYTFVCRTKPDCEEIHSYAVFIPIVGYVVLRNLSGMLRTRYSSFFAWFGRISLELFVCQYHIWLAADRHGVLVLLPQHPTLNVMLTSFIFVCISHEVNRITLLLAPFVVPPDPKMALRNFFVFLVIVVPVAWHSGMV